MTHARNFERCLLDRFGNDVHGSTLDFFKRLLNDAGTGNADVDDGIRFGNAAKTAGHERVVFNGIAEDNHFGIRHEIKL